MGLGLKRTELQQLAEAKFEDSKFLLRDRRYSNAYYLAGYAIEIALKSCIAKQFVEHTIPDKAFVNQIHTHNIKSLVGLAGLSVEFKAKEDADSNFAANFAIVARWTPEIRYETVDSITAQTMISAIDEASSGVFPWIRLYW